MKIPMISPAVLASKSFQKKILGLDPVAYFPLTEGPAGPGYLEFNGSSTNINCGSGASLNNIPGGGAFTVDGWYYSPSASTSGKVLISKGGYTVDGWQIERTAADGLAFRIRSGSESLYADLSSVGQGWIHVAGYFDGTDLARIAINGSWVDVAQNGSFNPATLDDSGLSLYFGRLAHSATWWLNGLMGWFRISASDRFDGATPTNFTPPARTTTPTVDGNTVALWPINEGYGSTAGDIGANNNDGTITNGSWSSYPAARDLVAGNDGTYVGTTLANKISPLVAPFFDGINDEVDIYTSGLNTLFNGAENSVNLFAQVASADVWATGLNQHLIDFRTTVSADYWVIRKSSTLNDIDFLRKGATLSQVLGIDVGTPHGVNWFMLSMTISESSDEMKCFVNASQVGSTQTGLGSWSNNLLSTQVKIGRYLNTIFNGYICHVAIWDAAKTVDIFQQIYEWSRI